MFILLLIRISIIGWLWYYCWYWRLCWYWFLGDKKLAANKSEADSNEAKTECPVNIKQHTICDIEGTGGSENHADPPVSTLAVNLGFVTTSEEKPVNPHKTIRFSESETDFDEFHKADGLSTGKERRNSLQTPWSRKLSDAPYVQMEQGKPREKKILDNVSVYFNPCELVAIMGPSGSGKTTLLDLLTGRRTSGHSQVRTSWTTVAPLFKGHPRDQRKCPLNRGWPGVC